MEAIVVALIAAFSAIASACISLKQNKKINETHKQVTVNGGTSSTPTVLDLLAEVRNEVRETNRIVINHLEWHLDKENE